jgi:hypothetical protein
LESFDLLLQWIESGDENAILQHIDNNTLMVGLLELTNLFDLDGLEEWIQDKIDRGQDERRFHSQCVKRGIEDYVDDFATSELCRDCWWDEVRDDVRDDDFSYRQQKMYNQASLDVYYDGRANELAVFAASEDMRLGYFD